MTNIIVSFLELIVLSSAVMAAVLLIRLLFNRKLHITILSLLWILVLARLLIPFTFNAPVSIDSLFKNSVPQSTPAANEVITSYDAGNYTYDVIETDYNINTAEYEYSPIINEAPVEPNVVITEPKTSVADSIKQLVQMQGFWIILLTIWAIGAWLNFISNGYTIYSFSKTISACKADTDDLINNSLNMAKQIIGINKEVKVLECEFISSPVTCGVINPKILLPKDFAASIGPQKLYMIFLHELSHIKNHDIFKNYLWLIVRIIYWFNPLVYIAYSKYQDDIEYICDETVLKSLNGQSAIEYTESLLDAVRLSSQNTKIPVALPFCKSKSSLRKRVENMLKPQKKSKALGMITMMLCAVLVIACFTTACLGSNNINTIDNLDNANAPNESQDTENLLSNSNTIVSADTEQTTDTLPSSIEPLPIKSNPVGSEQAAVEIARNLNISKTENFSYNYYFSSNDIMPVHDIMVQSDTEFTTFRIYDYNGEICMMQTSVLMAEELGEELPVDQLKQNVNDLAMQIYPNTRLDIIDCIRDTTVLTTVDGDEIHSKDYIVTGTLFDYEDNSTRAFEAKVRLDGGVRTISAQYSNMDYLMYSNDVRNKVLSYADSPDAAIEIYQIDEYYGDHLLHFALGHGKGSVTLLESDMSLVDIMIPNNDIQAPLDLPTEEILTLVQSYADYYFPHNEYVTIKDGERLDDGYIGEGSITFSYGTFLFYVLLDDNGNVHKMGIEPNVDKTQTNTDKISLENARENAINEVNMQCDFAEKASITIINSDEYKDDYMEAYLFSVEYISDSPSVYDYSFSAQVYIDVFTGEYRRLHIEPVLDGLDLLTENEAIALGRQYIEEAYGINGDELVCESISLDAFFVLQYQVNYKHGEKYYSSLIMPDTGENADTGTGG